MPGDDWPPPKAVHAPLSKRDKDRLWFGRRCRGRPSLRDSDDDDDGLLEMAVMIALDNDLAPWPAALEVASHLTIGDRRENVAKRLQAKFRQIKSRFEKETLQDWMDDDLVFTIILIAWQKRWPGRLVFPFNPPLYSPWGRLSWSLEEELGEGNISRKEAFLILLELLREKHPWNRQWRRSSTGPSPSRDRPASARERRAKWLRLEKEDHELLRLKQEAREKHRGRSD
jgi:hypothetical protein